MEGASRMPADSYKRKERKLSEIAVENYQRMAKAGKKKTHNNIPSQSCSKSPSPTILGLGLCFREKALSSFFSGTMEGLDFLQDRLKCVICGTVPDTVYSTPCCEHKYCVKCIPMIEGKICLICDIQVPKKKVKVDKFLTGLVYQTRKSKMLLALPLLYEYWRERAQTSSVRSIRCKQWVSSSSN